MCAHVLVRLPQGGEGGDSDSADEVGGGNDSENENMDRREPEDREKSTSTSEDSDDSDDRELRSTRKRRKKQQQRASRRRADTVHMWMYCIFSFPLNVMKVGISSSQEEARDANASTFYGTIFAKYFQLKVMLALKPAPLTLFQWEADPTLTECS